MGQRIPYTRRKFVKAALGAMVVGPTILVAGCQDGDIVDRQLVFRSLREGLDEAERLAQAASVRMNSGWTLSQTLNHCAQSIEYSMTGFPEMKSTLFQKTAGAAAFSVFAWRGRMSHNLTEPIPGAPSLQGDADLGASLTRLTRSVQDFEASREPLQAHFAYGQLDKSDYELAHAMHLANHFSMIVA